MAIKDVEYRQLLLLLLLFIYLFIVFSKELDSLWLPFTFDVLKRAVFYLQNFHVWLKSLFLNPAIYANSVGISD